MVWRDGSSVSLGGDSFSLATSGASASNGLCTVYADGSSVAGSGNQLTVTLEVTFSAAFAGTHAIEAYGRSSGTNFGDVPLGIWTVPRSACTYAINPGGQSFGVGGGTGSVNVTAAAGCAWTATSFLPWLTVTGSGSGSGNGSVSYSVGPSPAEDRRAGTLLVGGQGFQVTQAGAGLTVLSVTPNAGAGNSGRFTFQFSDAKGYRNIDDVVLVFEPPGGCLIMAQPDSGYLYLGGDSLSLTTSGASVSNGLCTVYSDGSSVAGSGNQFTVTVQMAFSTAFAGTHAIRAYGQSSGVSIGSVPLGTWTVSATACTYAFNPASQNFGAAGGTGSIGVTAPAGCAWTASSFLSWLTVTGAG